LARGVIFSVLLFVEHSRPFLGGVNIRGGRIMTGVINRHEKKPYHCALCGVTIPSEPGLPRFDVPCPSCGYPRWCRARTVDECFVIELLPDRVPELDDIERLADSLVRSQNAKRLVLDLSSLDITSSLLLARLILLNKRVQRSKGRALLTGLSPMVRDILHSTRIDTLFEVAQTEGVKTDNPAPIVVSDLSRSSSNRP
jgi:anti-anti-sigma factor